MKTGLSYFEDGGEVEEPAGALTKPVAPKGKFAVASPLGAVPLGQSTLENMQRLLEEKQAQQGSFLERLKDAKSVFSGYGSEQTQAMDTRNKQREEQASNIFQIQNQLAQQKASQAQLANLRAADNSSGWGKTAPVGQAPVGQAPVGQAPVGQANQSGFSPDVVSQYNRILDTQGIGEANKFKNEQLKVRSQYEFNPALDQIVKFPLNNQMVDMTLRQAKKLAENNPQLQVYLEKLSPGSTSSVSAAAPTAVAPKAPSAPVASMPAAPAAPAAPASVTQVTPPAAASTPIRTPSATIGGGGALPSSADIAQRMEIEKAEALARTKGREKEFEEVGKASGEQRKYIETAGGSATNDLAAYQKLDTLVTNNPLAFGVLQNPGILSGALKAIQEGSNVGNYNVNIPGVETLVRQAGGTKDDITAANIAIREFAKLQLNASKLLAGQGSVSDAERQLLKQVAGSVSDDPRTIKDMIKWGKARAEYDRDMGVEWKKYQKAKPDGSYRDFYINSPAREKLVEGWKVKTEELLKDYESLGKKPVSGARAELDRRRAKKQEGF